jgi:hypothetical protein
VAKPFLVAFVAENEMLQPIVVGGLQGTFGASIVFGGFYAIATVIVVNMKSSRLSLH